MVFDYLLFTYFKNSSHMTFAGGLENEISRDGRLHNIDLSS
jgi:hypothetical protein